MHEITLLKWHMTQFCRHTDVLMEVLRDRALLTGHHAYVRDQKNKKKQ